MDEAPPTRPMSSTVGPGRFRGVRRRPADGDDRRHRITAGRTIPGRGGVGEAHHPPIGTEGTGDLEAPSAQTKQRPARGLVYDRDIRPSDPVPPAGSQRLQDCLLAREPGRIPLRPPLPARVGIRLLAVRETAPGELITVPFQHGGDPIDLDEIHPMPHDPLSIAHTGHGMESRDILHTVA